MKTMSQDEMYEVIRRLERMSGRSYSGASVREAAEAFECLFWEHVRQPFAAPRSKPPFLVELVIDGDSAFEESWSVNLSRMESNRIANCTLANDVCEDEARELATSVATVLDATVTGP